MDFLSERRRRRKKLNSLPLKKWDGTRRQIGGVSEGKKGDSKLRRVGVGEKKDMFNGP